MLWGIIAGTWKSSPPPQAGCASWVLRKPRASRLGRLGVLELWAQGLAGEKTLPGSAPSSPGSSELGPGPLCRGRERGRISQSPLSHVYASFNAS